MARQASATATTHPATSKPSPSTEKPKKTAAQKAEARVQRALMAIVAVGKLRGLTDDQKARVTEAMTGATEIAMRQLNEGKRSLEAFTL